MDLALLLGIFFCLTQSAVFSGLTLGLFGLTRLKLEIEVESGNKAAAAVLDLRRDANLLLTTLLWGNVSINVLLTLLTDSVLTGLLAFFFSSVCITIFGEILPQAYFSRNALRMGILLVPVIKFYKFIIEFFIIMIIIFIKFIFIFIIYQIHKLFFNYSLINH